LAGEQTKHVLRETNPFEEVKAQFGVHAVESLFVVQSQSILKGGGRTFSPQDKVNDFRVKLRSGLKRGQVFLDHLKPTANSEFYIISWMK
jgi:hypothetical protein